MHMTQVAVTGAYGKTGRVVVRELLGHGYDVVAIDITGEPGDRGMMAGIGAPLLLADLTDYGQAVDALRGVDAVVHLANIPAPGRRTPAHTLTTNLTMNSNVFLAAEQCGVSKVVWASSETTLGLPFDVPPRYAPVDEDHFPVPTTTYALSKVASETLATHVAEWSGIPFTGLRLSNVHVEDDYQRIPSYWGDPHLRKFNLWGYIDARDVAGACHAALSATTLTGADNFIIAAEDTVMDRPSADLLDEVFPGVKLTREIGTYETLLAIGKAREVLGFTPQYTWRNIVSS
jgi:nucleoside-diphosphate-sugar epimerase